ncbi:MAG: hypothetical protein OQJ98_03120 [Candidatus Pacebacteria bacterium]|nr:hypothetical protein [Candidatus Paceibacterota bacterium]
MAEQKTKASQDFVPVEEIRDGIVVLKDGSLRSVFIASSLNFALKSADEQNAILSQFQNFLNSLEFSVQIFVQSRELDIRPYVALLEEQLENTVDDLMQIQIREYIDFVKSFVDLSNIMTKNFFVIVPYAAPIVSRDGGAFSRVFGKKDKKEDARNVSFEESRSQLEQRMAVVEQGLVRSGVRVIKLDTEELIELYYKMFNPGEQEKPIALNQGVQRP